jgi:hypothetical protein
MSNRIRIVTVVLFIPITRDTRMTADPATNYVKMYIIKYVYVLFIIVLYMIILFRILQ